MITRQIASIAPRIADGFPVVVLTGPRQAGKTTLARSVFSDRPYVSLEDPLERAAFASDAKGWLARFPDGAVIDEVQRAPELPSYLQGIVDADGRMGRWILTGSQQYMVLDGISQSLAGRAALLQLLPFSHDELTQAQLAPPSLAEAIWRGGYPPLYDRPVDPQQWLSSYLATYVERDVRSITAIRDLNRFTAFVRLCATRSGQVVNHASMAAELQIDAKTVRAWLSVLEAGYIIRLLPPWYENLGKRVSKQHKLYFIDTGLCCRLLGIGSADLLPSHTSYGALAETWVIGEVFKSRLYRAWPGSACHWWRSHDGLEVDLVLEQGSEVFCAEIKASATPSGKHLGPAQRFAKLLGKRHRGTALIHGGDIDASLAGCQWTPWNSIDKLVAGWGQ